MVKTFIEGKIRFFLPDYEKISRKMPVFYNSEMKLNRDLTIEVLRQFPPLNILDAFAASGVRAIRIAKELDFKSIIANDINPKAFEMIKKNMKLNEVNFEVRNEDANLLIMKSKGFDFIDLDVFGCPNFVLDSAIKKIFKNGILAVTATDTAALTGTYPKATLRKYWACSVKNSMMHEQGIRILIRKIQLIGTQYDKGLMPIFSYFYKHYYRIFFKCLKGKKEADWILISHGILNRSGPLWLGRLWDTKLVEKMYFRLSTNDNKIKDRDLEKFLRIINEESKINTIGFYNIHEIVKKEKIRNIRKKEDLIKSIRRMGYDASQTHFSGTGIKTTIDYEGLVRILNYRHPQN